MLKSCQDQQCTLCAQSCPALRLHCHPPSSSVHGIFQIRTLEWAATSYSQSIGGAQVGATAFILSSHLLCLESQVRTQWSFSLAAQARPVPSRAMCSAPWRQQGRDGVHLQGSRVVTWLMAGRAGGVRAQNHTL